MPTEIKSSDESPATNPCCPIDGPRCPHYWQCFDAIKNGNTEYDRPCREEAVS